MQASDLIFIVLPVVIPLALAIGVALPFIADSRATRAQSGRQPSHHAVREHVDKRAPDQGLSSSRPLDQALPGPADRAA